MCVLSDVIVIVVYSFGHKHKDADDIQLGDN